MLPPSDPIFQTVPDRKPGKRILHCGSCGCKYAIRVQIAAVGRVSRCGYCLYRLRQSIAVANSIVK